MLNDLVNFLSNLEKNNNKIWFNKNRDEFKVLIEEFNSFVTDTIFDLSSFDSLLSMQTYKDCVFRQHRDIRFSKDKSPYKTTKSMAISHMGKNSSAPVYYLQIEPTGNIMIAVGLYMPQKEQLKMVRDNIVLSGNKISKIMQNKELVSEFGTLTGDALKTYPRGYDKDHKYINLLKQKSFLYIQNYNVNDFDGYSELRDFAVKKFKIAFPLIKLLRNISNQII